MRPDQSFQASRRVHFLAVLTAGLMCFLAAAQGAEKSDPVAVYNDRLAGIARRALNAELLKRPDRLDGVSMKLRYSVDRDGHVHNAKAISRTPDGWAEKTAVGVLSALKFPPIPMDVQLEVGAGYIDAEAELSFKAKPEPAPAWEDKNSAYYRYTMRVHKLLQDDLVPAFHGPPHLEVDYEFYLDPQGRVTSMKVHAKSGGQRAEQIMARSIRHVKYPPVPPQAFKDLGVKPPLKVFGTMTWDPQ